ncbi:hypothetical protein ACFL5V_00090 [Fibrobacterota bacterium]
MAKQSQSPQYSIISLFQKKPLRAQILPLFLLFGMLISGCAVKPQSKSSVPYSWSVRLIGPLDKGHITTNAYIDDQIIAFFQVFPNMISMQIKNLSDDVIYLLWNQSYIVVADGIRTRIIHSKVKFQDRLRPLDFTAVKPEEELHFFVASASRSDWNQENKKWRSFPIIPGLPETLVSKGFIFNLSVQKGGTASDYPFEFNVRKTKRIKLASRPYGKYQISPIPPVEDLFKDSIPGREPIKPPVEPEVEEITEEDLVPEERNVEPVKIEKKKAEIKPRKPVKKIEPEKEAEMEMEVKEEKKEQEVKAPEQEIPQPAAKPPVPKPEEVAEPPPAQDPVEVRTNPVPDVPEVPDPPPVTEKPKPPQSPPKSIHNLLNRFNQMKAKSDEYEVEVEEEPVEPVKEETRAEPQPEKEEAEGFMKIEMIDSSKAYNFPYDASRKDTAQEKKAAPPEDKKKKEREKKEREYQELYGPRQGIGSL